MALETKNFSHIRRIVLGRSVSASLDAKINAGSTTAITTRELNALKEVLGKAAAYGVELSIRTGSALEPRPASALRRAFGQKVGDDLVTQIDAIS